MQVRKWSLMLIYIAAAAGVATTAMAYINKTRLYSMFNQVSDCEDIEEQ